MLNLMPKRCDVRVKNSEPPCLCEEPLLAVFRKTLVNLCGHPRWLSSPCLQTWGEVARVYHRPFGRKNGALVLPNRSMFQCQIFGSKWVEIPVPTSVRDVLAEEHSWA